MSEHAFPSSAKSADRIEGAMIAGGDMLKYWFVMWLRVFVSQNISMNLLSIWGLVTSLYLLAGSFLAFLIGSLIQPTPEMPRSPHFRLVLYSTLA